MGNILKETPSNHLKLSVQGYNSEITELVKYIGKLKDRITLINNELDSRGEEIVLCEHRGLNIDIVSDLVCRDCGVELTEEANKKNYCQECYTTIRQT